MTHRRRVRPTRTRARRRAPRERRARRRRQRSSSSRLAASRADRRGEASGAVARDAVQDAQGLNRAVSAATDARALEDLVRENEGLMNAINCANVAGRAAKMCARAEVGRSRDDAAGRAARAVLRRVADVAAASMRETPNEWWPRQCATVVWACGRAGARHEEVERAMEGWWRRERRVQAAGTVERFWGLAKVNSDRTGLYAILGERIRVSLLVDTGTDHQTGWTPQGVSNVAWSLGSMTPETRRRCSRRARWERSSLPASRRLWRRVWICLIRRSARTRCRDSQSACRLRERTPSEAQRCSPRLKRDKTWMTDGQFQCQHVSNVVWACAKLNMNDDAELIDVLVRASDAYSTKFNSQELSMVLWGFATLAVSDHKIMHTLAKSMARKVDESSAQQMATAAHALAKIGVYNSQLVKAYKERRAERRDEFQPRDIAFLAWSYAKLNIKAPELFEMFNGVICEMLFDVEFQTFSPHHLTMVLWSYAMLGENTDKVFPSIIKTMKTIVDDFNPRDMTNTAWALAALGCDDKELISALERTLTAKLNEFNSQELLKFLGSFERLGVEDTSLAEAVSSQRTLSYEFPAIRSTIELTAATRRVTKERIAFAPMTVAAVSVEGTRASRSGRVVLCFQNGSRGRRIRCALTESRRRLGALGPTNGAGKCVSSSRWIGSSFYTRFKTRSARDRDRRYVFSLSV